MKERFARVFQDKKGFFVICDGDKKYIRLSKGQVKTRLAEIQQKVIKRKVKVPMKKAKKLMEQKKSFNLPGLRKLAMSGFKPAAVPRVLQRGRLTRAQQTNAIALANAAIQTMKFNSLEEKQKEFADILRDIRLNMKEANRLEEAKQTDQRVTSLKRLLGMKRDQLLDIATQYGIIIPVGTRKPDVVDKIYNHPNFRVGAEIKPEKAPEKPAKGKKAKKSPKKKIQFVDDEAVDGDEENEEIKVPENPVGETEDISSDDPESATAKPDLPGDETGDDDSDAYANPQVLQFGGGELKALWENQIYSALKPYKQFIGVIARDELSMLPYGWPCGFVMNTDIRASPGEHWVAVYLSGDSLEYYDPLGNPPPADMVSGLLVWLESMRIPRLVKFKHSNIKHQRSSTETCGYHCIRFLSSRFEGIPFKISSLHDVSGKGEREIKQKFGYL